MNRTKTKMLPKPPLQRSPQWEDIITHDYLARILFRIIKLKAFHISVMLIVFAFIEELATQYIEKYPRTLSVRLGDIVWDFILVPILWVYYAKSHERIPKLFGSLLEIAEKRQDKKFKDFIENVIKSFKSFFWPLLAGIVSLTGQSILFFSTWQSSPPGFYPWPLHVAYSLALGWLNLYALLMLIIREFIAISHLRFFFSKFKLNIHLIHPDNAGGSEFIGRYYFNLAFLGVILGMMISFWSIVVPLINGTTILPGVVWPIAWICYLVVTPSIFLLPVWTGHMALKQKRDELLNTLSVQFDVELKNITKSNDRVKSKTDISKALRIKDLREFVSQSFPLWPYSTKIWREFSLSASLPVVTSILSLAIDYVTKVK